MHSLWMVVLLVIPVAHIDLLSSEMLRLRGGFEDDERAAFLVRGDDGLVALHHWPHERGTFREAHWNGPLPHGVAGVIHTHPAHLPRPSGQDSWEARRLGIPFYVVSRTQLCIAHPDGTVTCRLRSARTARETTRGLRRAGPAGGAS